MGPERLKAKSPTSTAHLRSPVDLAQVPDPLRPSSESESERDAMKGRKSMPRPSRVAPFVVHRAPTSAVMRTPFPSFLHLMPHAGCADDADDEGETETDATGDENEPLVSANQTPPLPPRLPQANFGDIMPSSYTATPIHASFGPRERLVLSANGNLQRLISSYYNKPVSVHINYNRPIEGEVGKYDREVEMDVDGKPFGVATSYVELGRADLIDAVENQGVAIGQLFRHYKILPAFRLLECSKDESGAFQRTYMLEGDGVSCRICEKFVANLFDLWPEVTDADGIKISELGGDPFELPASPTVFVKDANGRDHISPGPDPKAASSTSKQSTRSTTGAGGHFGDIMATNKTGIELPDLFDPLQRVLLTANGNFERLVSSFYASSCTTELVSSSQSMIGGHDMVLSTSLAGEMVMTAKWTVHLIDQDWIEAFESGVGLGGLFAHFKVLPTFQLHSCGKFGGYAYLWRTYSLVSEGMVCEVHETIDSGLCNIETGDGGKRPLGRTSTGLENVSEDSEHRAPAPS